jgi:hypothetical protein
MTSTARAVNDAARLRQRSGDVSEGLSLDFASASGRSSATTADDTPPRGKRDCPSYLKHTLVPTS